MAKDVYMLENGTTLHCALGAVKVVEFIGDGGQGEVYRVTVNGSQYALKYYFKENCKGTFKKALKAIIDNPVEHPSFAWPLCLVENGDHFGI